MGRILLGCVVALALAGSGGADDKKGDPFEAMRKAAAPGPFHKKLDPLAGSWTWTSKFYGTTPPQEGSGTAERKWIMDGRFLQEDVFSKELLGQPFKGFGLTGYDNMQKKYVAVWT